MPKKWIRDEQWQRQPHAKEGPPLSLWWYRRPDKHLVIAAYISQCKKGRAVPEGFKEQIARELHDLSSLQNKKAWGQPRTYRYWTIPAYAFAHKIGRGGLMKRLREMEKLARELFPDSVPSSRKPRPPLTETEIHEMRQLCLAGIDIKEIAQKFNISASRVGHLCRNEKKQRAAARERAQDEILGGSNPAQAAPDDLEPF